MEEFLLKILIEKQFFGKGTEVEATHRGLDLSGRMLHTFENSFTVSKLMETRKSKRLVLELKSTADGSIVQITPDQILTIDGMTPERFAENFMIDTNGNEIKVVGKRRGRRPKNWVETEAEAE